MDEEETAVDFDDNSDVENEMPSEEKKVDRKRNYHNILERKRRNHIKDGYLRLRDTVPSISGKKVSRIQILKKAIEYIRSEKEEIRRRETHYREMKERSEFLKRIVDFMKTKDFGFRSSPSYSML